MNNEQQDQQLWKTAKARVNFRRSLATYLIINAVQVAIWYLVSGAGSYFWPVWSILGWGIAIAFQYFNAYQSHGGSSAQEEYEKLKRKQELKNN
ncbi:MAG: 2TM domain-containing protein [Chitinophagaceae bacterium]|nr:2TM domain-containing protein [Chitinophagaceae bacterium]